MSNTRAEKINKINELIEWCKKVDKSNYQVPFTSEQKKAAVELRKRLAANLAGEEKALDGLITEAQQFQDNVCIVQSAQAVKRMEEEAKSLRTNSENKSSEADNRLKAAAGNWLFNRAEWVPRQALPAKTGFDLLESDLKLVSSDLRSTVDELNILCRKPIDPKDFLSESHEAARVELENRLVKIFAANDSLSSAQILQLLAAERENFERHQRFADALVAIEKSYTEKGSKQDKPSGKVGPKESAARVRALAQEVYGHYLAKTSAVTSLEKASPSNAASIYKQLHDLVLADNGSVKRFMSWDVSADRRGEKYWNDMRLQSKVIPSVLNDHLQKFLDDEISLYRRFSSAVKAVPEVKKPAELKVAEVKAQKPLEPLDPLQRDQQIKFAEKILNILMDAKLTNVPMNAVMTNANVMGFHFPDLSHDFAKFLIDHFRLYKDKFSRYQNAYTVQSDLVSFADSVAAGELLKKFIALYKNEKYLEEYLRLKEEERSLEDYPLDEVQFRRENHKNAFEKFFKKGIEQPVHSLMPKQIVARDDKQRDELYSDHLPITTVIQVDDQQQLKLGSWNIMSPNQQYGFGDSIVTSEALQQERKISDDARIPRVMQSINMIIRMQQLDVMVLQEAETMDKAWLQGMLPPNWGIQQNGETWALYNRDKLDLVVYPDEKKEKEKKWSAADQKKYGFETRPIVDELVFRVIDSKTKSYVAVNNVHYSFQTHTDVNTGQDFEGYPVPAEICTRALLSENYQKKYPDQIPKDAHVLPIVVGDMNAYVVPVNPDKNVSYVTGVRPPKATNDIQAPNFIDGCFTLGPDRQPYQQALSTINPQTGGEHKEPLPDPANYSALQWTQNFRENYVRPMTLDPRFKLFEPETVQHMESLGLRVYQSVTPLNQRFAVFKKMNIAPQDEKLYDLKVRDALLDKLAEVFGNGKDVQVNKDSHIAIPAELFAPYLFDHRARALKLKIHTPKDPSLAQHLDQQIAAARDRIDGYQRDIHIPGNALKVKLELFRLYYAYSLFEEGEGKLVHPEIMLNAGLISKDKREVMDRVKREKVLEIILDNSNATLEKLYEMAKQVKTEKSKLGSSSRSRDAFLAAGLSKAELMESGFAKGQDAKVEAANVSQAARQQEVKQDLAAEPSPEMLQRWARSFENDFFIDLARCGNYESRDMGAFHNVKKLFSQIKFGMASKNEGVLHLVDLTDDFALFLRNYLKDRPGFRVEADRIFFDVRKMAPSMQEFKIHHPDVFSNYPVFVINAAIRSFNEPSYRQSCQQLKLFKAFVPVLYPDYQKRGFLNELGNLAVDKQIEKLERHEDDKIRKDWFMVKEFNNLDQNDFRHKRFIFGKLYKREKEAPSKMFKVGQAAIDNAIQAAVKAQDSKQESVVDERAVAIAKFLDMTPQMVKEFEPHFEKGVQAAAQAEQPAPRRSQENKL